MKKDNIIPLGDWSADAVAADCAQRVSPESKLLCIWIDADGSVHWSKSTLTFEQCSVMSAIVSGMADQWARTLIEDLEE